ncbi:MAG: Phage integrase [Frankiales bacterium]|nr:Phage integrase [Frankiales bacterium]
MARRETNRLTVKAVESKKKPGHYADGGGLYLQVSAAGGKSWIFRYTSKAILTRNGKPKEAEMGLGSLADVSLSAAREKRNDYRKLLQTGIDPLAAKKQGVADRAIAEARSSTFSECATAYIEAQRPSWKNAKHAEQWTNTIETYCGPIFGALPVQSVDTGLVLQVLGPIWKEKPETASRLRGRIERVIDWAKVRGYRDGENPARWRGHMDKLLPKMEKRKRVKHHPALPFANIADFTKSLRDRDGLAARALELLILTATRTNETVTARWAEFDLEAALWTIPPERMKSHREHRIPLPARAVAILKDLEKSKASEYVFPGKPSKPLSNMALLALLGRMGKDDITVHGFRSTFRDWASERTSYSREVCEMALAHVVSDETEAAYRRSDLFDKRRRLLSDWAKFCEPTKPAKVIPIRPAVQARR